MPNVPGTPARGSLARALALAFVAVGLLTAAIVVATVALTARSESASVAQGARSGAADAVGAELAAAYRAAGRRWAAADLTRGASRAAAARAALIVRDDRGALVGVFSPNGQDLGLGTARLPAPDATREQADVTVDGTLAGRAELRFAGTGLTRNEQRLRDSLVRAAVIASLAAILIALLAAALVARRLRRPLQRLTGAARELEAGNAAARVDDPSGPGELGELSIAFDRMAEALASQQQARSAMVSDLAHELRTPLTILRGSLEELLDGDMAADPAALSSLQDEVLRLERLTDDLWALSESEPSFLRLTTTRLDLGTIAQDAAAALEQQARAADVTVEVRAEPVFVDGDARRLTQVAGNLLVNAVKFTPDGGTVRVAVGKQDGWATLAVSDSGPGIPTDELPHVFDRFWRGAGASGVSGTGVGLAIVERLVRAHGGTVTAGNTSGGGAEFVVRLPLV